MDEEVNFQGTGRRAQGTGERHNAAYSVPHAELQATRINTNLNNGHSERNNGQSIA
jgi:hypothetical protein